ncbi:MAG TPA: S41 family peptidase [Solirubrobacteraceae bacterium]
MRTSSRQPLALALVLAVLGLLALGLWFGGHPEDLPGFLRSAFVSSPKTAVVDEAIQRIADDYYRPIPTSKLDDASISGLVASLGDRFSHYLTPSEYHEFTAPPHFTGIGVAVGTQLVEHGLLIERVFNSSPAARAGLKAGEVIVAVNGRKLAPLSADAATSLIRGLPGTDVQLGIQQPAAANAKRPSLHEVKITRAVVSEPVVESATKTFHGVKLGVVALASFSVGSHSEVRQAVEHELQAGARGLVFDLRDNGGGLVEEAQLIASIFIPKGQTIVTTRGREVPTQVLVATGDSISSSIPMVVLVDADTASSSEIVTAALQDHHRATVVGTHTFGKGVFQEEQALSNGGALDITVGEYFTPNGRNLGGGGVKQGAGVIPEVRVPSNAVDTNRGLEVALSTLAAKVK